jgi:hypothetical protein
MQTIKQLGGLALLAFSYFVLIIVVMHFLRPDHDPIRRPTSEYAVGPYGFLMTSAFIIMSLGSLALVVGLYRGVSEPARSTIGLSLLGVWVLGLLVAATFPIDLEGTPPTTSGTVHRINGPITFLSLTVGAILVSRRLKHDENWLPVHRIALFLSLLMLAEFIVNAVSIASGAGYPGLGQRVFIVTFVAWLALMAARLSGSVPASRAASKR